MKGLFATSLAILTVNAMAGAAITPALKKAVSAHPGGYVRVNLWLTTQPAGPVSREVRSRYEPLILDLSEQAKAITRQVMPVAPLSPAAEKLFAPIPLDSASVAARKEILRERDALWDRMTAEIAHITATLVKGEQASVAAAVRTVGGTVVSSTTVMSTMTVDIPARSVSMLATHLGICTMDIDHPGAPELDLHGTSLGLTAGFWANGITGGIHDIGVLDTGVQQNHPAFAGHPFQSNGGTTDSNGHGTGIAGIMASVNATYRGMAWGCDTICVAIAGTDATSMSGMHYLITGTTQRPENVNYSFGNGTANDTDYSSFDRFFDGVIDTYGVMVSKSTGNGGWGTTTITHPAPAYNLLASANMDDFNTVARTDDRITSSSSRGPTLGGRKKPDITAPGTNSMTTNNAGGFSNLGGTSSASPHTGGGIVLLLDMGVSSVIAAKAILLNAADAIADNNTSSTADDAYVTGSFWNKTYGWGYLDLGEAYLNGLDYFAHSMPAPAGGGRNFKLYKGFLFAGEKSTLVWNRHVAYNGSSYPTQFEGFSNLDLAAYSQGTNALLKSSTSTIDNVEQIDVATDGSVVLKVYTTGTFDPDVTNEPYALATEEGFTEAAGPSFEITLSHPASVGVGANYTIEATVKNIGDVPAHDVSVTLDGGNSQSLGTMAPGAQLIVSWNRTAPMSEGTVNFVVGATSSSYGETFTGTKNGSLEVVALTVLHANSVTPITGSFVSGTLSDTFSSDDQYLRQRPGAVAVSTAYPCVTEYTTTSPFSTASILEFRAEMAASVGNIGYKIELLHNTNGWVSLATGSLPTTDTVLVSVPGNPSDYVGAGGVLKARVSSKATAAVPIFPWNVRYDRVWWTISP